MENPSAHVMTQLTDSIAFATSSGAQLSDKIQFAQFVSLFFSNVLFWIFYIQFLNI